MRTGIIYMATGPSGRSYIGQTVKGLKARMRGHKRDAYAKNLDGTFFDNRPFARAIRKYKITGFKWEIIHNNISQKYLNMLEAICIIKRMTHIDFGGFNCIYGNYLGWGSVGENNPNSKLKLDDVIKIRSCINSMECGINDLADKYKVSRCTIERIVHNKAWTDPNYELVVDPCLIRYKLNWDAVNNIRKKINTGNYKCTDLAREYKVSVETIDDVIHNKTWVDKDYELSIKLIGGRSGESHHNSKLNWNIINDIRAKINTGIYKCTDLAKEYNISNATVNYIINNKIWCDPSYFLLINLQSTSRSAENSATAKLNWKLVKEIRSKFISGEYKQIELAREYGLHRDTIHNVVYNKTWEDPNYNSSKKQLSG